VLKWWAEEMLAVLGAELMMMWVFWVPLW
jgi:hypothetical protein